MLVYQRVSCNILPFAINVGDMLMCQLHIALLQLGADIAYITNCIHGSRSYHQMMYPLVMTNIAMERSTILNR